jgi:hypothetical protein
MALITLKLFVDIDAKTLTSGKSRTDSYTIPTLYQGDTVALQIWLLKRTDYYNTPLLGSPYSAVALTGMSCRVGIGNPSAGTGSPTPPIYQNTFTIQTDATGQYFNGELYISPSAVASLIGTATSGTAKLEIEINEGGKYATVFQGNVTLAAELIEDAAATEPPMPTDGYYTKAETNALFVPRSMGAGDGIQLVSPDGSKRMLLWLDNDGTLHTDLLT